MKSVPKAEIHIHIEAVLSLSSVKKLYKKRHGVRMTQEMEKDLFSYTDLNGFVRAFLAVQDLFQSVDDLSLIFDDLEAYMQKNGVTYCEAFFAPSAFIKKGFSYSDMVSLFEKRIADIEQKTGAIIKLLMDVSRTFGPDNAMQNYQMLVEHPSPAVIGIGLGGSEAKGPAAQFAEVFQRAHQDGLHAVAHAGEDVGPQSVWDSINVLHAERIGHGISSVQDNALMDSLAQSATPVEVCITSNVFTKKYVSDARHHPIKEMFKKGLLVTVNTDDPVFFRTTLLKEYWLCHYMMKFTMADIRQLVNNSWNATFLSNELKEEWVHKVDAVWEKAESVYNQFRD